MPLPDAESVLYSDLLTSAQIDAMYPGARHPDIVSDSEHFPDVDDGSFDFVVANHVLEHLTDPIGALIEWHRILRPGGLLLFAVPDKRYTFDHARPRTSLRHLIDDHRSELPPQQRNDCHLLEWAEHVEGLRHGSAGFDAWVDAQRQHGFAVHNHVWIARDVLALLLHLRSAHGAGYRLRKWRNTSPLGNEFILLVEKCAPEEDPSGALRRAAFWAALADPMHAIAAHVRRAMRRLRS